MENIMGQKIRTLRENKGLTQDQLATELKDKYGQTTSRSTIIRWEAGDQEPQLSALKGLSRIFGVTMDYLANDEPVKVLSQEQKFLIDFVMNAENCQINKCIKIMSIISEEEKIPHAENLSEIASKVINKKA